MERFPFARRPEIAGYRAAKPDEGRVFPLAEGRREPPKDGLAIRSRRRRNVRTPVRRSSTRRCLPPEARVYSPCRLQDRYQAMDRSKPSMKIARRDHTSPKRKSAFPPPPHFRRNFAAILIDYVSFGVAFSFLSPNAVLPAFVRTLTDSEPVVGLVNTVFRGGWLLPQLAGAAMMSSKPRKKPHLLAMIYLGRPLFLLLALLIWPGMTERPVLMLAAFFLVIALFAISDSIASVAWFDILARAIPLDRRGGLVGTAQLLIGVLGVGVGLIITRILKDPRLPYPTNYALIFAMAAVAFLPSTIALTLIREPPGTAEEPHRSLKDFLGRLEEAWRREPWFRQLIICRLLLGTTGLALPFYVVHAIEEVGLPHAAQGWFVSAGTIGSIAAGLGFGWMSDRHGPLPVIRLGALAGLLVPLLALGFHFAPSLAIAYPLLYFLQGLYESSWMPGAINYVLEAAPDSRRPLYIGLYNTLAGILVATSFLGGILLQATSFPVLFVTVAVGTGLGVAVSTRLPTPKPRPRLTDRKGRSAVNRRARPATSPAGAEEARRALSSEPGASSRAAGPPNRFSSHPNRW